MAGQEATCYADDIHVIDGTLCHVAEVAQDTFLIRIEAPEIACRAVPGQFVMIRFTGRDTPLIGRALAIYDIIDDAEGNPRAIDLVFVRKGAMTTPLAIAQLGTPVTLWGPLGNGFSDRPCDTLVIAVGGIGQTPMLLLAQEALGARTFGNGKRRSGWAKRVVMIYGARTAALLACLDEFGGAGIELQLCTDDGSVGQKARVPDRLFEYVDGSVPLSQNESEFDRAGRPQGSFGYWGQTPFPKISSLGFIRVVTCGPEIMMQKVAQGCIERSIDCQVSMETPMACGIGICFSCVAKVRIGDGSWDYRRTCVEGPIFDANDLVW